MSRDIIAKKCYVYLARETGSYLLQLLVATMVTALVFWGRLKYFILGLFKKKENKELK